MSNSSQQFDPYGDCAHEVGESPGNPLKPERPTAIDLAGVPQIPLDCFLALKQSERSLTAEQWRRCDQAIADACVEMHRRKLVKLSERI